MTRAKFWYEIEAERKAAEAESAEAAADARWKVAEPEEREHIRQEVQKHMALAGVPKEEARKLILRHDDRITVHRKYGGEAEAKIDGILASAKVEALADELTEKRRLLSYGPDPAEELFTRLAAAGMARDEAWKSAQHRIKRERDGCIVFEPVRGEPVRGADAEDLRPLDMAARTLFSEWEARQNAPAPAPVADPVRYVL
jgi:hypothetical protein